MVRAPENATVYLNKTAVFTCKTSGGLSGWRVNGILRQNLQPKIQNDIKVSETSILNGTTVEELSIVARAEYNGTRVQCVITELGGSHDESENATLEIQGIGDYGVHVG